MMPASQALAGGRVADLVQCRVERALRRRTRYRYVKPKVWREGPALRIASPCCSRNVDADGGVIDIALLRPAAGSAAAPPCWSLYARDHAWRCWTLAREQAPLDELLELLCVDADRVFWP